MLEAAEIATYRELIRLAEESDDTDQLKRDVAMARHLGLISDEMVTKIVETFYHARFTNSL